MHPPVTTFGNFPDSTPPPSRLGLQTKGLSMVFLNSGSSWEDRNFPTPFGSGNSLCLNCDTRTSLLSQSVGLATTQNLVVKFNGEICGGVLVENASDDFPSERSSKTSCQTSPEVRHQFRRKLRQLHSGNCWCLNLNRFFANRCLTDCCQGKRRNSSTRLRLGILHLTTPFGSGKTDLVWCKRVSERDF